MLKLVAATALLVGFASTSALAQAPAPTPTAASQTAATETWNGLPDGFQVDDRRLPDLRRNGPPRERRQFPVERRELREGPGESAKASTIWGDATWRLGRRHQLKFGYTRFSRESQNYTLGRTFTWNDQVYNAGLSASASVANSITSAYYRLALVKTDRVEIGPAAGLGYLTIDANIRATGTVNARTVSLDQSKNVGQITGDVGAFFNAWVSKIVVVRADFLYIKVSPGDLTASVTDGRIAVDVYPSKHVGIGAQ